MKKYLIAVIFTFCLIFMSNCVFATDEHRESVLDKKIHIEEGVILDIPNVPPYCDEIKGLKKGYADIGGCKLYYEEEGKGIPLVIVSGGPGCTHQIFHPYFSNAKGFARVIYYDQRGVGQSDKDETWMKYTVRQAVDDLDSLRKKLKIDKWVVMGYSYGGILAQCYALEYPQNTIGLVLVSAFPVLPQIAFDYKTIFRDILSKEELNKWQEIRNDKELSSAQRSYNCQINGAWKCQLFYKPTKDNMARFVLYGYKPAQGLTTMLSPEIDKINLEGKFKDFYIPTLIMEGKYDHTWAADKAQKFSANHPNAKMVVFEKSAHNPFEDESDKFFKELKSFFAYVKEYSKNKIKLPTKHVNWPAPPDLVIVKIKRILTDKTGGKILVALEETKKSNINDVPILFDVGLKLFEEYYYKESLDVWNKIIKMPPKDVDRLYQFGTLVWLGHNYDILGDRDKAVNCYQKALKIDIGKDTFVIDTGVFSYAVIDKKYVEEFLKNPFSRNK